jgi:hypothetical protein
MHEPPHPALAPASAKERPPAESERVFLELRRKVQESELLSASTDRLLCRMNFNGRLTVVIHNGRVFKSSYEEGYFRRKNDFGAS